MEMICVKDSLPQYKRGSESTKQYYAYYLPDDIHEYTNIEDLGLLSGIVFYYGRNKLKDNNWHNVIVLYWCEIPSLPKKSSSYLKELWEYRYNNCKIIKVGKEFYYMTSRECNKKYDKTLYPINTIQDIKENGICLSKGDLVINDDNLPYRVIRTNPLKLELLKYKNKNL